MIAITLTSPFKLKDTSLTRENAVEIFYLVSQSALEKLAQPELLALISDKDEILIVFD